MFRPVNEWLTIAFSSPHKITIMWVILKIFICNLLGLAEYQCKGVAKFNLSDLFSGVSFGDHEKGWILLLTVIAVTRIINLVRCISQFKCFKCPIFIFYFRPALFFKKQVIINFFSLNLTSIEIELERVSSSQNKCTLGGEGARKQTMANKGGGRGSKLGNFEWTYFLNVSLYKRFQWNLPRFSLFFDIFLYFDEFKIISHF